MTDEYCASVHVVASNLKLKIVYLKEMLKLLFMVSEFFTDKVCSALNDFVIVILVQNGNNSEK